MIIAPGKIDLDDLLPSMFELEALGVKTSLVPDAMEVVGFAGDFEDFGGLPILGVREFGLSRSSLRLKRGFDLLVGIVLAALSAPLMLVLAVAVRLSSPGPVLFRQPRVGRGGKTFQMLKFRTMVDGAHAIREDLSELNETVGIFKIGNDPRITRVGRLLRASSLDELPQLINVVIGEMSLVGPRPLIPEEDAVVEGWARHRLDLRPGMTGHWQVLGSTRLPLQEMVKIDYLYIVNWSLWTDIRAMLSTLPHVVGRRGL